MSFLGFETSIFTWKKYIIILDGQKFDDNFKKYRLLSLKNDHPVLGDLEKILFKSHPLKLIKIFCFYKDKLIQVRPLYLMFMRTLCLIFLN